MSEKEETHLKDALQRRLNLTRRQIRSRLQKLGLVYSEGDGLHKTIDEILALLQTEDSLRAVEREGENA